MAKTRTRRRRSTRRRIAGPASPRRGNCRARSCPTTTSTTPMRPMNASPSSTPSAPPPASSSSTPIPAASPKAPTSSAPIARRWPAIPTSAYGGIVALNRTLDADAARAITEMFTEVIIAPDATDEAIAIVAARRNLRLLLAGGLPDPRSVGPHRENRRRRPAGAEPRQRRGRRHDAEDGDQARADRRRIARSQIRVPRRQARQVEHHRLCQGSRHRRHRRGPDEPGRFRAHRRAQGAGCRRRS